jgi:hypothetical protein
MNRSHSSDVEASTQDGVAPRDRPARSSIVPNGREFIVMVNGSAFVALTLAGAQAIANRSGAAVRRGAEDA